MVHVKINNEKLKQALYSQKIVFISDLHVNKYGFRERRLVKKVNQLFPDMILLGGDYLGMGNKNIVEPLHQLLNKFKSRYGIWAILGNNDEGVIRKQLIDKFHEIGIHLLVNQNQKLSWGHKTVYLAGVDSPLLGLANLNKALQGIPKDAPVILLAHSPRIFYDAYQKGIDLILSGDTHGGQIRLPIIGELYSKDLYEKELVSGIYRTPGTVLYVNRGIGVTRLPFRFRCRAEITVLEFQ